MNIEDLVSHTPLERIYLCQKNAGVLNSFWLYEQEFSESFCAAACIKYERPSSGIPLREEKLQELLHFIEYTCAYLLRTPKDVISVIEQRTENESIDGFLKEFVEHPLTPELLVRQMVRSPKVLAATEGCDDWLDWPLRAHAKSRLCALPRLQYSSQDLIPCGINRNRLISEYILGWAFEAGQLCEEGIETFRAEFPRKFQMLKRIQGTKNDNDKEQRVILRRRLPDQDS